MTERNRNVTIIGAGVVGLSVALQLQELGHHVLIVAKDFPAPFETIDRLAQINYTSPWAGAQNGWGRDLPLGQASPELCRDHSFALKTFARMTQMQAESPEAGINLLRGVVHYDDPPEKLRELDVTKAVELGIDGFQFVPREKLPKGVTLGFSYNTWTVNSMVYCCFLLRKFTLNGGRIIKRELRSTAEAFAIADIPPANVVVNASGTGFGDEKVFITRGQTCLVANDSPISLGRVHADGTSSFCIPRKFGGGTIIGGTHEPHNWDSEPTHGLRDRILEKLTSHYPEILGDAGEFTVLADIVGRRPTREGGLRLEEEDIGGGKFVVHAYGAGGRGYELSWGIAEAVGSMIRPIYKV